jgi:hypothetical protein
MNKGYKEGDRVEHQVHGKGKIIKVTRYSRYSDSKRVFVRWESGESFALVDPTLWVVGSERDQQGIDVDEWCWTDTMREYIETQHTLNATINRIMAGE